MQYNGNKSRIIKEFQNIGSIAEISILKNKKYIFSFYRKGGNLLGELSLYNEKTNLIELITDQGSLRSFNYNKSCLLFGRSSNSILKIFSFDPQNNKSSFLFDFSKNLVLGSNIFQFDDNSYVFLSSEIRDNGEIEIHKHLVLYDLNKNEYCFINEDKKEIDCLDVFVKR